MSAGRAQYWVSFGIILAAHIAIDIIIDSCGESVNHQLRELVHLKIKLREIVTP